ncbi:MAG: DNA polymerase IV [Hungatella sp.]
MPKERIIFHVDVNSAFLSWESVDRLREDPTALDLRTIPAVIGGDEESRHGIVLAKSTSAKAHGIVTGEPIAQARKKCPGLTIVPSRFEIYIESSSRLMTLLDSYSPDIEKFSIDEAFVDMTDTIHLFGTPMEVAAQLRERIHKELGFTVNIGIAPNKLLAKMASDFQKPDRCHSLWREEIPTKLWPLPIRELFFVGGSAERKMLNIGIRTIGDLAHCDVRILRSHLGSKYADLIYNYANGIDEDPVSEKEPLNKGYGNSTTLSRDISDYDTAYQVLLSLSETVGARLRHDHVVCNCICVEWKDWEFHVQSHQMTLDSPTDSTAAIYQHACTLLHHAWDLTPVRLLGIRTSKIREEGFSQMNLFDTKHNQKMEQLEKTVDSIRDKFGVDSIKRASFLQKDVIVDHAASKHKHLS